MAFSTTRIDASILGDGAWTTAAMWPPEVIGAALGRPWTCSRIVESAPTRRRRAGPHDRCHIVMTLHHISRVVRGSSPADPARVLRVVHLVQDLDVLPGSGEATVHI